MRSRCEGGEIEGDREAGAEWRNKEEESIGSEENFIISSKDREFGDVGINAREDVFFGKGELVAFEGRAGRERKAKFFEVVANGDIFIRVEKEDVGRVEDVEAKGRGEGELEIEEAFFEEELEGRRKDSDRGDEAHKIAGEKVSLGISSEGVIKSGVFEEG